jgi:hypothetical protein
MENQEQTAGYMQRIEGLSERSGLRAGPTIRITIYRIVL